MELRTSMKTSAIISEHNAANPEHPLASWKGSKKALIDRVVALGKGHTFVEEPAAETPAATDKKPAKRAKAKKAAKAETPTGDRGAIKDYCETLLMKVVGKDAETGKPLGMTYAAILDKVRARFPDASTTVGCLRWYATHLNSRHRPDRGRKPLPKIDMPVRPKSLAA